MALRIGILRSHGGRCAQGLRSLRSCSGVAMVVSGSSKEKSTVADLWRKLAESRDREIAALKMALEARKCEARAIAMFNKRMKIDVWGMVDDASGGGHSRELRALRKALVAQEKENLRIMERNRELQREIERLGGGGKQGVVAREEEEEEEGDDELRPFEQCFIKVCKPSVEKVGDCGSEGCCGDLTMDQVSREVIVEGDSDRDEELGEEEKPCHDNGVTSKAVRCASVVPADIDTIHPWPEWVLFMDYLRKASHLKCSGGDKGDGTMSMEENVKAAAMSFCAAHDNLLQRLSQDDLMVFGSFGCPNADRRIVNSGKRLRKYLNLAESDVCKFCSRSKICSRAYCDNTSSAAPAENSDILWLLLQYGFDAVSSDSLEKRPLPDYVERTIRSILQQLVFLAENAHAVVKLQVAEGNKVAEDIQAGNWRCKRCKLLNFSGSKTCRGCSTLCGHDLFRTGEWKCFKCNLTNLARNLICQDCSAPRPPKELRWGDWECPNCHGVNFARNRECFRCNSKQPPYKDRPLIGVNKNTVLEKTSAFTLGATPWLRTKEEKEELSIKN